MAMAFRGYGNGIVAGDNTVDYGIPQLSSDVVAAGKQAPKSKFGAWDAAGILGDALQSFGGGRPTYTPIALAERQHQRDLEDAAAQRQAQVQDWLFKQQYQAAHPDPSPIERDVDAFLALTPEKRAAFGQLQDLRAGPTTIQFRDGSVYSGSRAGLADALSGFSGTATGAAVPTTQNTPAPKMGANGNPQFLTPEQYQATVSAMGQQKTDEWIKRNGIPIAKTLPNGVTAYQINGKWYDNPEGR